MSRFLCPVCRAPRNVDLRDHISITAHMKIASTAFLAASLCYIFRGPLLAFKVLLFVYLPLWAFAEFIHWSRVRRDSRCPQCYFDPILYKQDWRAARKIVEDRLQTIADQAHKDREQKVAQFLGKQLSAEIASTDTSVSPTNTASRPQDI